jgi:hypothetical protein
MSNSRNGKHNRQDDDEDNEINEPESTVMTLYFLHLGRRLLWYNCFILLRSDLYNNRFLFSCETPKTLAISYFFAHLWMAELQPPTLVSSPTNTSICQGTWTSPSLPRRRHSLHSRGSQPFWWNGAIRCSLGSFPAQDSLPPADVVSNPRTR